MKNAAVNMDIQVSFFHIDSHSFGYMPKNGMAGS
jgi:hypothetical protein